jgi:hypothetical protein
MPETMTNWNWLGIFGLGAFHGLNPGMGWLFAVALGLQERRRGAVWSALGPLAVGHVLATAAVLLAAVLLGALLPVATLKWIVAGILLALGGLRLVRHRHPRWASMRVSLRGLTVWSFLMAFAHGAGLMVLPLFLNLSATAHAGGARDAGAHCATAAAAPGPASGLLASSIHGLGYLLVTAVIAVVVYEKLGLGLLRRAWINLDLIWAAALLVAGGAALFL